MANVTNWVEHLSAEEVVGAVYPGAGSAEGILVILGIISVSYTHLTLPTNHPV